MASHKCYTTNHQLLYCRYESIYMQEEKRKSNDLRNQSHTLFALIRTRTIPRILSSSPCLIWKYCREAVCCSEHTGNCEKDTTVKKWLREEREIYMLFSVSSHRNSRHFPVCSQQLPRNTPPHPDTFTYLKNHSARKNKG